jgi:hypothetical protein
MVYSMHLGMEGCFDYLNSENMDSPSIATQTNQLAYEWSVLQTLRLNNVFLHAAVVTSCSGSGHFGMPGEACVSYENTTFDIYPATWNTPSSLASSTIEYSAGNVLFTTLLNGQLAAIPPQKLFVRSLRCQLSLQVPATICVPSDISCLM